MWQALKSIFCCSSSLNSDQLYDKAQEFFTDYQTTEDPQQLKKAIENYRAALAARRKERNPDEGLILVNYATALWARYRLGPGRAGELEDIIQLYEGADVQWRQEKATGYPELLLNLGNAYYTKSLVPGDDADMSINKAIDFLDRLNSHASINIETRIKGIAMLGVVLNRRCSLHKSTNRLNDAILRLEEAAKFVDAPDDIRILCYTNLATAYYARYRYQERHDRLDLDKAIDCSRMSFEAIPEGSPEKGNTSYNLANQLFKRYELKHGLQTNDGDERLTASRPENRAGLEDLEEAFRFALEAQRLLEGTGHLAAVEKLLDVIKTHREASSQGSSRADTPNAA